MGADTGIGWTTSTWNSLRGCRHFRPECDFCYAEVIAGRFSGEDVNGKKLPFYRLAVVDPDRGARWTGEISIVGDKLDLPLRWKRPRFIFSNSVSDLYYEKLTFDEIALHHGVMLVANWHVFQTLTKRAERMLEFYEWLRKKDDPWGYCIYLAESRGLLDTHKRYLKRKKEQLPSYAPDARPAHILVGLSTGSQKWADKDVPFLMEIKRQGFPVWLSMEPLIGPVNLYQCRALRCRVCGGTGRDPIEESGEWKKCGACNGYWAFEPGEAPQVDWVVVGGESGPREVRPMHPWWASEIQEACAHARVPFFFKQWGSWGPRQNATADGEDGSRLIVNLDGSVVRGVSAATPRESTSWLMEWARDKGTHGEFLGDREWKQMPKGFEHITLKTEKDEDA